MIKLLFKKEIMFKVIKKDEKSVMVEMDIDTYNWVEEEINEDFSNYEFVFEEPIGATELLTK